MPDPQLIRIAMKDKLKADEEWKALAKTTRKRLKEGFYGDWMRVFIDKPDSAKYSQEEASAFMFLWAALNSDQIAGTQMILGVKPDLDNPVQNAVQLSKPNDTDGMYYGGMDEKGNYHVGWKKPLAFAVNKVTGKEIVEGQALLPPMRVSLQVGYIDIFDLLAMLSAWRHVARWPSDADSITVLQIIDPDLWSLGLDLG